MAWSTFLWYMEEACFAASAAMLIWQGYRDDTFGMPLVGIIVNFTWSFWFSVYVDTVYLWDQITCLLHLVLLAQAIWHGHKEFFAAGERAPFYGLIGVCLIVSLGLMRAVIDEEGRQWAHNELYYGCMFLTSILFVQMLLSRGDARGQHIGASILKTVGLLFAWFYQHSSAVIGWLCFGTLLADGMYIYLLFLCMEQPQDFHQWRRFLVPYHSNGNEENENPLMMTGKQHHGGGGYFPAPMNNDGDNHNKNTNLEMLGGV